MATRLYYPEGEVWPQGGTRLYYSTDQLGSVRDVLVAQNGARVAAYDYDAYGNPTSSMGRVSVDFRYAGMFYHQASNLYLTQYRAFNPKTARWLSRDPIEEEGGLNLYGYVGGNPASWIDPLGLKYAEYYATSGAAIGGSVVAAGSLAVDAATGGLNILATPAELGTGSALGGAIGYGVGSLLDILFNENGSAHSSQNSGSSADSNSDAGESKGFWNDLDKCKGSKTRTNGEKGKKRRYYEWDYTHGDVEVYNGQGKHLGSADPQTGKMIKPPVPGRKLNR